MIDTPIWAWSGRRKEVKKRVKDIISAVGLDGQARQKPATLSGGERQRVALARALSQKPRLLLADEPTGNLDSGAGKVILELLTQLNREGQTIIMVTHDPVIAEPADRKLVLHDGKLN